MNGKLRRALCLLLSLVLLLQAAPVTQVKAQAVQVPLPEVQIGEDILANDLFYLASTSATLREGANETYLLRVGRGGGAETESSVLVKISDVTAEYGKDYTVSVLDGSAKVEVPEGNVSLMDLIAGQPFELTELKDENEAEAILTEDEEGMAAAEAGVAEALNYLAERSGLADAELAELDPVQQARNLYTGIDGSSQHVTASENTLQQLQRVANVMTEVVPGAGVVLTFAPGETEKLLEITVKDNDESDGDRMLYVILAETDGSTTNSAASTCAVTIADDEEQILSVVSFSQDTYSEITDGMATVTLHREGALNSVVTARVKTAGGTATAGRDYSEVNREILFPFGVSDVPLQIPVDTSHFDGEADFRLTLEAGVDCETAESDATVVLTGAGSAGDAARESAALRTTGVEQTLTLVKTDDPIDLNNPEKSGYNVVVNPDNLGEVHFTGHNQYSDSGWWEMDWTDNSSILQKHIEGNIGVVFKLTDEANPYWYNGARVTWATTDVHSNHHALLRVAPYGVGTINWDYAGDATINSYVSAQAFGNSTVDFYPTKTAAEKSAGTPAYEAIQRLAFTYYGYCDNCNWLWIYKVEPILRPFEARLINPTEMSFLQEDGSYVADSSDPALNAYMDGARDKKAVVFLGDAVSISQYDASNVNRYLYLSGIEYVPANRPEAAITISSNTLLSNTTVTLKMTKENIKKMFSINGSEFAENTELLTSLQNGTNAKFYQDSFSTQAPTYGVMQLRPKFQYIDASVKLENPYDFSVCYTISGTEYWVGPQQTRELTGIHLGDTLAISSLQIGAGYETEYVPVGVDIAYNYKKNEGDPIHDLKRFSGDKSIYLGGEDRRLCYEEVTLTPNLIERSTQIVVRVKTADLDKFEPQGLLSLPGTVNGAYTEYVYVGAGQMISGKIYPIPVVPKSDDTVCVWELSNKNKYVGNTFLFEAGRAENQNDNTITLTTESANSSVHLEGTLYYKDYNLRTHDTGMASSCPAEGATVAAGNMMAIADENGRIRSNDMKVPRTPSRFYVRCLITVGSTSVLRDVKLQLRSDVVDISETFDTGVNPASAAIFQTVRMEIPEANISGLVPLGSYDDSFHVSVKVKPVRYTVQRTDGSGSYTEEEIYERPIGLQLKLVDATGQLRYAFDELDEAVINSSTGDYTFTQEIPFQLSGEDGSLIYAAEPGDRLLVSLTTDLLSQASELEIPAEALALLADHDGSVDPAELEIKSYTYSNINSGYGIYTLNEYVPPVEQGLADTPIEFSFTTLPLLGDVGSNYQFPFVNVGWTKTEEGYRMFIGVSPINIIDKVNNTMIARYAGDDGTDWAKLFAVAHPFKTWKEGLDKSFHKAFADNTGKTTEDVADLGSRQFRFNFHLGMYFDFTVGTVKDSTGLETTDIILSGMGAYISATVGVKKAWYFIIPVVFIPAYVGVQIEATVMGFFGAHREDSDPNVITYNDAITVPRLDLGGSFNDKFKYCIQVGGMVQISAGVGLCGTIGVRLVGEFDALIDYEPEEYVEGSDPLGANLTFKAGGMVDLFLASLPLMYSFPQLKFGKFENVASDRLPRNGLQSDAAAKDDPFTLRTGYDAVSEWLGNASAKRGAFTPKQTYTLVENSYERADPQLITLKNGTVVLAYLSNDPDKGPYQRTTLMLTTCRNGIWSEPVVVSDDGTADFQPSIAETNDGRVLLAWVSTEADDITDDTPTADYLRSMEVFAAFAEIGSDGTVSVGETQRISKDQRIVDGEAQPRHYYDANPTVICNTENGDAIIYFIKSGSLTEDPTELANPYVNDSVICYLPYDSEKGKWMTDEFYEGELSDPAAEQTMLDNFCGQRFLDAPTFENAEGGREFYAIPDFTAIGYDGKALYAYTVDRDSSNDTETDKELFLQVYSFADHRTYHRIRLTDDVVSDALPQFVRTARGSGEDAQTVTELFWYRAGKGVCYLDISMLLEKGINNDGTLKPKTDGSGNMAVPFYVDSVSTDENASRQMADFRVVEDANGSIYVVWTASAPKTEEDAIAGQELFAVSRYVDPDLASGAGGTWSKPYQLTNSGLQNDELALTLDGENLLVVHNQYQISLTEDAENPLSISDLQLAATTLEPCGSVKTRSVTLLELCEDAPEQEITLPQPGQSMTVRLTVANEGLTTAEGYHVDVWQVTDNGETLLWSHDADSRLFPNTSEELTLDWTAPEALEGAYLRVETKENNYNNREIFTTEPLAARASYELTAMRTYQAEDGFHLLGTLTNNGNAATAEGENLTVRMTGPYDLSESYSSDELLLYSEPLEALAVGESREIDATLDIPAEMLSHFRYIGCSVGVTKEVPATNLYGEPTTEIEYRSSTEHVEFRVTRPVNFRIGNGEAMTLAVEEERELIASLELGELLGGDEVLFTVDDVNVARIRDGKLVGVKAGEATLYATHAATGATVSVPVTVTGEQPKPNPFTDVEEDQFFYDPVLWAYYHDPQITAGTSATTFSPNDGATRAQVVTFLWRAAGSPEPKTGTNPFEDVPDGKYYTKPVLWAAEEGITRGTSATTFSPNNTCTRGEFVTFLYRFAGSPSIGDVDNLFEDVDEGSFYYLPVLWAVEQKVTAGTSETTFSPKKICTRGEIVTFLYRYMGEE